MSWKLWYSERPTDHKLLYRWRVSKRQILGLEMQPEWSAKLQLCGMGYADNEYWPPFSNWDGYTRSVDKTLEWRPAEENETENTITWNGLNLLPSPFNGSLPDVTYTGQWINAPPYKAESIHLHSWMVNSLGWRNAAKMRDAWNTRCG